MAVTIVERQLSLGTEHFTNGVRDGTTMALTVGIGSFAAIFLVALCAVLPLEGIVWWCLLLLALYALAAWYVVALVALVYWASVDVESDVRGSFARAVDLLFRRPVMGVLILVQSIGWFFLSLLLVIAPFVVTPGLVIIISAGLVVATREELAGAGNGERSTHSNVESE